MEFGRIAHPEELERLALELPADAPGTAACLELYALGERRPRLFVGAPVWAQERLARRLYPPGLNGVAALSHYAHSFHTLELNSTFYADAATELARLARAVPEGFRFAPKLSRAISHDRRLVGVEAETERFAAALASLGPRRGPAWLLAPPDFGPRELPALERWLEVHAARLRPLAVELREPKWFGDRGASEAAASLFERHGVAWILTDVVGRRDVLHMRLTAPLAFLRFTGNRLHASDFTRLDAWLERLGCWFDAGLREAWLFLHQPDEGLVVELAQHLADGARARLGIELPRPQPREIARQTELF